MGGSIREIDFLSHLACMSEGDNIFACDEAHLLRSKTHGGRVNVWHVSHCILYFSFLKALCIMLRRSAGVSMPLYYPSTL